MSRHTKKRSDTAAGTPAAQEINAAVRSDDRPNEPLRRVFTASRSLIPRPVLLYFISFGASALFLLLGPYSNFAPPGFIDPWVYTGYFTHFSYLLQHYGVTYYVSRLPWIAPGLLVFKVLTPAAATVCLHALIVAASVTALYTVVSVHYRRLPALLACIALITNPYFISSVSWDYPDGPAIAYAFLALTCFLHPGRRRIPNSAMGGAFLALSGYTNLAGLPVLLGIVTIPFWHYKHSLKELLRQSAYIVLGGSVVTVLFAGIGKLLLHTYFFFWPQINMIKFTIDHPDYLKNMWGSGYGWIPTAYRLFPPLFILFLGGVWFLRRRRCSPAFISSYICLWVTCALFAVFEFVFHNVGLRVAYCSSYIVAPLFVFAGLLIGECLSHCGQGEVPTLAVKYGDGRSQVDNRRTASIWLGVMLVGLLIPVWYAYGPVTRISIAQMWPGMLIAGLLAATCAAMMRPRQLLLCPLTCCLIFVALFFGPAHDAALGYVWSRGSDSVFQSLLQISSVVDVGVDSSKDVRFWYDADEPPISFPKLRNVKLSYFLGSAYSLYLWGYFDFTKELAVGSVVDLRRAVCVNTTFVHLTMMPDKLPERTRLLASRGIITGNERRWILHASYGELYIVLQDVLDASAMH